MSTPMKPRTTAPVVSVSLEMRALFRLGGRARSDPTSSMRLASGDVVVLGGRARRAYHGVDRIYPTSTLIPGGGRSIHPPPRHRSCALREAPRT